MELESGSGLNWLNCHKFCIGYKLEGTYSRGYFTRACQGIFLYINGHMNVNWIIC